MTVLGQLRDWLINFMPEWAAYIVAFLVGVIVIITFVLVMVLFFIYIERRGVGRFQLRLGPNRVGPEGILQPIADAIKVLTKEDIVPRQGDWWLHFLAPIIAFLPALMVFAVIPLHKNVVFTDLDVGILYVVAISSISVVGIYTAGWASNNKYSLVSALRTVAQAVSYELPIVLAAIGVILMVGSLSLSQIVEAQTVPFLLLQPLGFLIFLLGSMAEINRSPFDLLEAESEIVAGYHTEYSGMKFALFYLAEYGHTVAASAIITTLFLGGWKGPFLPPFLWFVIKVILVFAFMVWVRSTLPRLRVDQLMAFAWKGLLPMALINLFLVAAEVLWFSEVLPWGIVVVNLVVAGILILLWSRLFTLGGGRVEV